MACAGWFLCQVHRDAGDWDTAMAVTLDVLSALESRVADGTMNLMGALRRAMATTGYTELKEFQRIEVVVQ